MASVVFSLKKGFKNDISGVPEQKYRIEGWKEIVD